MSWQATRAVRRARYPRAPHARHVLLCLADRADAHGVVEVGQRALADDTGMSRTTVRRWLHTLLDEGSLQLVAEGGPRKRTLYRIAMSTERTGLWAVR